MTVDTWAGPTKPSICTACGALPRGGSRMAAIAAGVSTWLQITLKLASRCRAASRSTSAVGGVVVSKPMAKNTISRPGSRRAIASASAVEYTMRTSAPWAFAFSSDRPSDAGTRRQSP